MNVQINRLLQPPDHTFFLFGPRGTGKSTWLKKHFQGQLFLDLLDSGLFLELAQRPGTLGRLAGEAGTGSWVVIDEVQKVPALLDEVHRLIEDRRLRFALCGSSARKLRRSGTNLLGGRALTRSLSTFTSAELADQFNLDFSLEWGMLPYVHRDPANTAEILRSYVNTYLKEEIREEGVIRNVPPFLRFLGVAGMMNGRIVNAQNIAQQAGVSRGTIDQYWSIMEDTLIGGFLPAFRPRLKVREAAHPKFYWFDAGVARAASGLAFDRPDRAWLGLSFETLLLNELKVFNHVTGRNRDLFYYRTPAGVEIDFIIETGKAQSSSAPHVVCIEAKLSESWDTAWEKPMLSLARQEGIVVEKMFGVYTGNRSYFKDNLAVLPAGEFLKRLHGGEVF